jgi:hypothetical protein
MLACALCGLTPGARAQTSTVWEIGKFDRSSLEFNAALDFSDPSLSPTYTVGQSTPGKDWPAFQPGSEMKVLGGRPHPYTILFNLDHPPKGLYRLTISVLLRDSRIPNLALDLNGKSGLIYFNRKLSYYPGDPSVESPIYGDAQVEITLPATALRAGENKLVLTAVDDPKDGDGDSVLFYDALKLTQEPATKTSTAPQVAVEPTVLYTRKDNQLYELIYVTVAPGQKVSKGEVTLTVGREKLRQKLSGEWDFGQQRLIFEVPELSGKTAALVSVNVNGKTSKFPVTLEPKRKWTLYVVPHIHLDIGFTDYQDKVAELQDRDVDKLLDEIDDHPEMRFCLDGSWIVQNYLATRNAAAREKLLALVREGKMGVPAQYGSLNTGAASLEVLLRSVFYSLQLHQEEKIPFDYANITDVPGYSWSYASILNALGLKYFAAASNNDRAPILVYGRWNEKSPFYWQGPDGNKVLMSYSRQYFQLSFVCGLPPQVPAARQSLPTFLQAYQSPDYKPDVVLMYGSQIENTDITPNEPAFLKSWNSQYAYPKMVFATFRDYFRYIDQRYGSSLETVSGDWGPYWEDGFGTDAWYCAIYRSSEERALSVEKLSTLTSLLHKYTVPPAEQIRRMWTALVLYAEHTFTSWGGYSRPDSEETVRQFQVKDQFAIDARNIVNALADQSLSQLADQIYLPAPAFVVFNPLSWNRSELVETDLDTGKVIAEYPDKTPVPVEVLEHHEGYDRVRFLARELPSFGYKCYQVMEKRQTPAPAGETELPKTNVIENSYYRVEVDPATASVSSLFDKELQRQLVDKASPYRLNQYLYVAGGDETATQIVYLRKTLPLAKLTITPSGPGQVVRTRRTSYGQILTIRSSGLHAPSIETDIILFDHEKKIEFVNRLRKEPVSSKEAVYFAFPFAAEKPVFSYEIQSGGVDPSRDVLKGGNCEWFSVQHWVKVTGPDFSVGFVPIDAPLVTFGDINRGSWPETFQPKSSTVFSYPLNNYWHTNFRRVQSGDFTFRYALTSGRDLSPEFLSRFGRAAMTPFESAHLLATDKFGNPERPLKPSPSSFLELNPDNVVVENWKGAEDGQGTILRLLEVGGRPATARLNFPLFNLERAWVTNAVEENHQELKVSSHSLEAPLKPHEILTLRVITSSPVQ